MHNSAGIPIARVVEILGSQVRQVLGSLNRTFSRPAPITQAESECISFCSQTHQEPLTAIHTSYAGVIICDAHLPLKADDYRDRTLILVDNPRLAFMRVVNVFFAEPRPEGLIHPTAVIHPEASIHLTVYVGPLTYVGRCAIGEGTVIYGNAHIYSRTRIGRNVTIHAGTVIGADGFGYQRNEMGELEKFPHIGGVVIEDNVEIGANTCIDRGTLGETIIREGAKIDNLVHIAHNVIVGKHAAVIAHAMVGGSTRIGDYAWIAPSACMRDMISIGNRATVGLGALVVNNVPDGTTVMGAPARPIEEYKRMLRALKQIAGVEQA